MAITAPISKYKKNNIKLFIVMLVIGAVWFLYDGLMNKEFIAKHTSADGKADSTLVSNRKAPPYFFGAALLFGVYLASIWNKKIVADENELIISEKTRVAYDSIEKIDKTMFDSKGFFVITYKNKDGGEMDLKLSSKKYDNLEAVLEYLITKIS